MKRPLDFKERAAKLDFENQLSIEMHYLGLRIEHFRDYSGVLFTLDKEQQERLLTLMRDNAKRIRSEYNVQKHITASVESVNREMLRVDMDFTKDAVSSVSLSCPFYLSDAAGESRVDGGNMDLDENSQVS